MAATKITFSNKIQGVASTFPENQKFTFGNTNQIKSVVNSHADDLDTNVANIATNLASINLIKLANPTAGVVNITQVSDLPTASGGFHTLAANTIYHINAVSPILLGTNGIKFSDNSHVFADVPGFGSFNHTGTGFMFDNNTNDLNIAGVVAVSTLGKFVNFDGQTKTKIMVLRNMTVLTKTMGTIKDADIAFVNDFLFSGFIDGFTITGANNAISFNTGRFLGYTNTAIDFGTSTSDDIRIAQTTFAGGLVGSVSISGLVNSGNVNERALVDAGIFNGSGDALNNIDKQLVNLILCTLCTFAL